MSFNPLNYPLCFETPQRLTDVTSWHEHIPFAFTIVQMLKPKIFVELGTHKGDSYCAFCQAVSTLGLDTACYAVDTWEGDEHSGFYGPGILEELKTYHDSRYKGFSQLIQSRFEEALDYFSDGSIDLIHIDGCHTYDAIKHDFEEWLPKMSQCGVVLFHDINVHEREFGVWKFWVEVAEHYPCFEFKHGNGLGVLAVGAEVQEELLTLLNMGEQEVVATTKLYSYLGDKIALGHQLQARDTQITEINSALQAMDAQITEINGALQTRDTQITELDSALQTRDTQITELNSALQARDTQITELNSALQARDTQITDLNSEVQGRDTQITDLNSEVQGRDTQINELTSALQGRDTQINEINSALKVRDTQITEINSVLQARDTQINEINSVLQARDTQINEINSALQDRDGQITELNNALQSIQQSIVWRLLMKYQRLIDTLLPHATKRRHVYDLGIISIRIIVNDGLSAFLYRFKEKVHGSALNASRIALIQTNLNSPHVPMSLVKGLCGKFTFPTNNLNEIRILTATYQRKNSDLELHITNTEGQIVRKSSVKGHRIQDDEYTSFKFKPIKDSKEQTFIFKFISKGEPSAAVWHNESVTFPELALIYDDAPINGSIGFQAFADVGIKSRYDLWILKNEPTQAKLKQYKEEIQNFEYQPKISIVTPVYNPDVAWIKAAIESVINQVYGNWELCLADASTKDDVKKCLEAYTKKDPRINVKFLSENKGISGNSNEALSLATGEFIGFLDHDDEIAPFALYKVIKLLNLKPHIDFIYSDEDKLDEMGKRCDAFFKPDWSPDLLFSCMYTCHFGIYRKKIIDQIGGLRLGYDGSQDYDLVLRVIECTNSKKIFHIPQILYHWRKVPGSIASNSSAKNYTNITSAKKALNDALSRQNINGKVEDGKWLSSYRVKRDIFGNPKVSIIIPTKDKLKLFRNCIESIKQKTTYENYELIIIDNNSIEPETIEYLSNLNCTIVKYKENFNFSKICNLGASYANGDYFIFLNNDIEIITEDWIQSMLEQAQRKDVGAVGCKLLYPNGTIQHAGVVLGLSPDPKNTVAGHIFIRSNNVDHGYFGLIDTIRNYSAVTAAAMMVRNEVFNGVGGFDENLAVSYNDVDLCLKIREKNYLIVYTPFVELLHYESASRNNSNLDMTEVQYMMNRWGNTLKNDPYYNPNLSLNKVNCEVNV